MTFWIVDGEIYEVKRCWTISLHSYCGGGEQTQHATLPMTTRKSGGDSSYDYYALFSVPHGIRCTTAVSYFNSK